MNEVTGVPCGLKAPAMTRIVPSLPAASIPCMTTRTRCFPSAHRRACRSSRRARTLSSSASAASFSRPNVAPASKSPRSTFEPGATASSLRKLRCSSCFAAIVILPAVPVATRRPVSRPAGECPHRRVPPAARNDRRAVATRPDGRVDWRPHRPPRPASSPPARASRPASPAGPRPSSPGAPDERAGPSKEPSHARPSGPDPARRGPAPGVRRHRAAPGRGRRPRRRRRPRPGRPGPLGADGALVDEQRHGRLRGPFRGRRRGGPRPPGRPPRARRGARRSGPGRRRSCPGRRSGS